MHTPLLKTTRFVGLSVAVAAGVAALGSASQALRLMQPVRALVSPQLVASAQAHPQGIFHVILKGENERAVVKAIRSDRGDLARRLGVINGASAAVTGSQLIALANAKGVSAIALDQPVHLQGGALTNSQQWPQDIMVRQTWPAAAAGKLPTLPAIAVVDSGIQNRPDFGGPASRVIAQTTIISSGTPNAPGDGYGHGTFVAGIAAGSAKSYAGAAPSAPLVSIDVMNDQGMALTSDVIAACQWIIDHKTQYNIGVANFSLTGTSPASIFWDPLDQAVEQLWFDNVVVVAAAGNHGTGTTPSGVLYAPANDPFVITVGADDTGRTPSANNDTSAPWSSWGYTYDGFAKPDLAAPGRYLIGPVPDKSTLATTRPGSVVAPGYIQLSGTSFASPMVAGAAAYLLALHPDWTPDQIKGALMLAADAEPNATPGSVGVGLLNVARAAQVSSPPNPNLALDQFLGPDPNGGSLPVFDTSAWQAAALADPNWDAAAWGSAAWGSAAWGSAAWGSAAWGSAAWGSAAWGSAAWGSSSLAQSLASAAWGSAAWGSSAYGDASRKR
jgi:serine protease AprX